MRRATKGQTLVNVLITAVIIALICAGITRMLLVRYAVLNRATVDTQNQRSDTSGINRVLTVWAKKNIVCSDATSVGYTCSPLSTTMPGTANCKCCPADTTNDAGLLFYNGGLNMYVETPTSPGVYPHFFCP